MRVLFASVFVTSMALTEGFASRPLHSQRQERPVASAARSSSDGAVAEASAETSPAKSPSSGSGEKKRVVMKFGGSSLADSERVKEVAALIVQQRREAGVDPVVVCSAMGSTTNALLAAGDFALGGNVYCDAIRSLHLSTCDELGVSEETRAEVEGLLEGLAQLLNGVMCLGELSPRSKDLLVSFGERMSVRLVAAQLNLLGCPASAHDAWDVGFKTAGEFGNAEISTSSYAAVRDTLGAVLEAKECSPGYAAARAAVHAKEAGGALVPVVTGFLGADDQGRVQTLGRGGSDLTAAFIGAAMGFDEIQVWKDVDGMLTADPRVVSTAVPVESVTFDEASELAYFGAKILHPISMQPAMKYNIPVRIKNSYNPSHPGTWISHAGAEGRADSKLVTAITTKKGQMLVDVVSTRMLGQYGFLATVFSIFERHQVSVDVVATSEVSVSLTLGAERRDSVDKVVRDLSARRPNTGGKDSSDQALDSNDPIAQVRVQEGRSILSLIANVKRSSDVMAQVFEILAKEEIQVEMLSQGASKVNISLVLRDEDLDHALQVLHAHFFKDQVASAGPFVAPPEKDLSHRQ